MTYSVPTGVRERLREVLGTFVTCEVIDHFWSRAIKLRVTATLKVVRDGEVMDSHFEHTSTLRRTNPNVPWEELVESGWERVVANIERGIIEDCREATRRADRLVKRWRTR